MDFSGRDNSSRSTCSKSGKYSPAKQETFNEGKYRSKATRGRGKPSYGGGWRKPDIRYGKLHREKTGKRYLKEEYDVDNLAYINGINAYLKEIRMAHLAARYFADSTGTIYSLYAGGSLRKLKPVAANTRSKCIRVCLYFKRNCRTEKRDYRVDWLVLFAFEQLKGPAYTVYHKDNILHNNFLENLGQRKRRNLSFLDRGIMTEGQVKMYVEKMDSMSEGEGREFTQKAIGKFIRHSKELNDLKARGEFFEKLFKSS